VDLVAQALDLLVQGGEPLARLLVVAGGGFQLRDVAFDVLEFALGFGGHTVAGGEWLIDHADCAAAAKLFDPGDEIAVREDIITFDLHDDHELAGALNVEQHLGFALALGAE
jgi:hypothetical protein